VTILAAILDFSATDLFYNETNGSIELQAIQAIPKQAIPSKLFQNICLGTNINLLAEGSSHLAAILNFWLKNRFPDIFGRYINRS